MDMRQRVNFGIKCLVAHTQSTHTLRAVASHGRKSQGYAGDESPRICSGGHGKHGNGSIFLQETVDFRQKLPEIALLKSANPVKF
jgi:hypothetical protein